MASIVVHAAHCCPAHGCKYNNDEECPVVNSEVKPTYPDACEQCADEKETAQNLSERVKDQIVAESTTLLALKDQIAELREENRKLRRAGEGEYDVAVVVYMRTHGQDLGDAYSGARLAVSHALRTVALDHTILTVPVMVRKGTEMVQMGVAQVAEVRELSAGRHFSIEPSRHNFRHLDYLSGKEW